MSDDRPDPPALIHGAEVTLRPFRAQDAPQLLAALDETRPALRQWSGLGTADATLAEVEERLVKMQAAFAAGDRLAYAVLDRSERLLGSCALEHIDWHARTFQIGYWIRTTAQGRGFAAAAVRALALCAFARLSAIRVSLWIDSENRKSIALASRLGFALEGCLRNERLNVDCRPQDTLVFARIDAAGL